MKHMHAVTLNNTVMTLTEMQVPDPGPEEILLKVERAGICGTDLHIVKSPDNHASILGHEFSGTIVDYGSKVSGFSKGKLVTSMPTMACGSCVHCLGGDPKHCAKVQSIGLSMPANGAFAEYVVVGACETFLLPESIDATLGALVEPLAVGLKQAEMGDPKPGDSMLILGAGPVGIATLLWARSLGVGDLLVSDPVASRREQALKMGATAIVNPLEEDLVDFCHREIGARPKIVVECIGRPGSFDMAMEIVGKWGRVVIGGHFFEPETHQRHVPYIKEVKLAYSWMYEKRHYLHTLKMLAQQRIDPRPMVTHEISLARLPETIRALLGPNEMGKVLVAPGDN